MQYKYLFIENNLAFDTVWLNRPERRNALHLEMIDELLFYFFHTCKENNIRFVILRGKGKTFCSGADINEFVSERSSVFIEKLSNLLNTVYNLQIPVISIAHGNVYGGAIGLLSISDIVLAEKNTTFCFSETRIGLIPALISPFLEQKVNRGILRYLMISARIFNSTKACEMGLVNEIFENNPDEILQLLINNLTENSYNAMNKTKSLLSDLRSIPGTESKNQFALAVIKDMLLEQDTKKRLNNYIIKRHTKNNSDFKDKRNEG